MYLYVYIKEMFKVIYEIITNQTIVNARKLSFSAIKCRIYIDLTLLVSNITTYQIKWLLLTLTFLYVTL